MANIVRFAALIPFIMFTMTAPAYAYLDPGTGSIILQAIVGGAAAALFVGRGYVQRVKVWLGLGQRSENNEPPSK